MRRWSVVADETSIGLQGALGAGHGRNAALFPGVERTGNSLRAAAEAVRRSTPRARVAAVLVIAALAGALVWGSAVGGDGGGAPTSRDAVTTVTGRAGGAATVAVGGGRIWTVGLVDRRLRGYAADTLAPVGPARRVGSKGELAAHVAVGAGGVWVALRRGGGGAAVRLGTTGERRRVLSAGDLVPDRIAVLPSRVIVVGDGRVAGLPTRRGGERWTWPLPEAVDAAAGYRSVWTLSRLPGARALVTRRDPGSGRIIGRRRVPAGATAIAVGLGAVWVANGCDNGVLRAPVGPGTATCAPVGKGPSDVAVGGGAAWAADAAGNRVVQLDATTGDVVRAWTAPGRPVEVAASGAAVVAVTGRGVVIRLEREGSARPTPAGRSPSGPPPG